MHVSTIQRLVCPQCHTPLRLIAAVTWLGVDRVKLGAAACDCGQYAIEDGILDLYPTLDGITPAQWSNLLGLTAWGYERFWRRRSLSMLSGEAFPIEREWDVVWDMLQPEGAGLYLDLGCSTALQARGLAERLTGEARILALDFSMPMLREAARRIQAEGWTSIDLVRARGESLPLADGALAGIVCGGSLNEFAAPWPILVEARRAVQPGGRAVFMSLLTSATPRGQQVQHGLTALSGIKFWTPAATARLFEAAGWRVLEQRTWGMVGFTSVTVQASS